MRSGKLNPPFTKMPPDHRLLPLPQYQIEELKRSSQSPIKARNAEKKNKLFLKGLGKVGPKVYDFMDQGISKLTDREDPAALEFSQQRPFTPTINFPRPNSSMLYCRSNSTLLESSYDQPHMSFFNPSILSPTHSNRGESVGLRGTNFLSFHQNQRSMASIHTAQSRAESASQIYKMSSFNRPSSSMLMKPPPKFLSSRIMSLRSKLNFESGSTTPIGRSSSPKLSHLAKRFGNSVHNSTHQLDFEASSFIDEIASRCADMPLNREKDYARNFVPRIDKHITFGAGSQEKTRRKIKPKMTINNRITALQKAIQLKAKLSSRYTTLLKPEVQCQQKTEEKIKEIANKVKKKLNRSNFVTKRTNESLQSARKTQSANRVVSHTNQTLNQIESPEIDTSMSMIESEKPDHNELTFAWRSEIRPFETVQEPQISEEKSNFEYVTTDTNSGASQESPTEKYQIERYLQYEGDAKKLEEETENLLMRRPKARLIPKEIK